MDEDARNEINTGGGASVGGNVDTKGGNFAGRDQNINVYQGLNVPELVEALRQAVPAGDPTPELWVDAIDELRMHHTLLFEWKEVHNFLNDVLVAMGQFKREVERIDISGETPNTRMLSRLWRPVVQKVEAMLDWAATIKFISDVPFAQNEKNTVGPPWAIELFVAKENIDLTLKRDKLTSNDVFEAVFDFSDLVEQHMYLADKKLRSTAGDLYNLSSSILGRIST